MCHQIEDMPVAFSKLPSGLSCRSTVRKFCIACLVSDSWTINRRVITRRNPNGIWLAPKWMWNGCLLTKNLNEVFI